MDVRLSFEAIADCLPPSCPQLLEYAEGKWRPWLADGPQVEGGKELRVFGTVRGKAAGELGSAAHRSLELLLEYRTQERARAFLADRDFDACLRELLAAEEIEAGDHRLALGPQAAQLFERHQVRYRLECQGEPEDARLVEWLEQESRRSLPALQGDEYSSLLGVFGHHVGTLFKTSGAMTIWSQPDNGYDPTRRVLDKLLPIWGVSQAISLHKKQGEKGWQELLRDWVDPAWVGREDLAEQVRRSILSLALYVYAHGVDEPPFMPWVVHQPDGMQARWLWATAETVASGVPSELIEKATATAPKQAAEKVEVESQTHRLVTLPPLADNPILFDKTLALTIGLFEMLSNLRKYPEPRGAGREDRRDLADLSQAERQVDLYCREKDGSTVLEILQPVVTLPDGGVPVSRSVDRIRGLERSLLKGIIETGKTEVVGKMSVPHVVKTRQTWTYHWSKLLEEWKCHVNSV
ncbi:MAG: hypothetical protein KC910_24925 [Candidatus Eremiobacteraeota bacterium]|nr:hypothetical protein [Candidatus Eremiobacteraeota bacterium]